MQAVGKCSILNNLASFAALADVFGDLQIGLSGILEQFGQFRADGRVFLEQKLFKHDAVDADHLLEMGSEKVHESARSSVRLLSLCVCWLQSRCGGLELGRRVPVSLGPEQDGCIRTL